MAHKFELIKDIDPGGGVKNIFELVFADEKPRRRRLVRRLFEHPWLGRRLICDGNVGWLISGKIRMKKEEPTRFFPVFLRRKKLKVEGDLKRLREKTKGWSGVTRIPLENRPLDYAVVSPLKLPPH